MSPNSQQNQQGHQYTWLVGSIDGWRSLGAEEFAVEVGEASDFSPPGEDK